MEQLGEEDDRENMAKRNSKRRAIQNALGQLGWHASGKDPSAVGKLMEGAQPLANAGKLDELEKLVDQALEMLGETEKAPDVYRQE